VNAVRTIGYGTWADFKRDLFVELFGDGVFRPGQYLFRGTGQADWQLESYFDRQFAHVPLTERLALWDRLIDEWRRRCREEGVPEAVTDDERALWALGQHHGLPTRMLDWTTSPYVAAFFAFRAHLLARSTVRSDVAVWVLHTDNPIWDGTLGVEVVNPAPTGNARLRNQGGRFTLCRAAVGCLEDFVARFSSSLALTRCLIPSTEARVALADLDAMGITSRELFPDLDGLAGFALTRACLDLSLPSPSLSPGLGGTAPNA
jgi:hypothetical protein